MMNKKTIIIAILMTTTVLVTISILVVFMLNRQQTTPTQYTVQSTRSIPSNSGTSKPDLTTEQLQQELQDIAQRQRELEQTNQILEETIQVLHTETTTLSPTDNGATNQTDITKLPTRKMPTVTPNIQATTVDAILSPQQASDIATDLLQVDPPSDQPYLVAFQGRVAYEVIFVSGIVYIDAASGEVLYNTATQYSTQPVQAMTTTTELAIATPTLAAPIATVVPDGGQISQDQAREIAINYVGNGSISEIDTENEHGIWVYEVKFTNGSKVYVDIATGRVVYAKVRPGMQNQEHEREHGSESGNPNRPGRP